jgi:hypothetical protein
MAGEKAEFITVRSNYVDVSEYNQEEYTADTRQFQRDIFKEADGIASSLVEKIIGEKRSARIKIATDLRNSMLLYFENEYKEKISTELYDACVIKMEKFVDIFEKEFLLIYSEALKVKFAEADENLESYLEGFISYILFEKGDKEIGRTSSEHIFYKHKYEYKVLIDDKDISLRDNLVDLATFDFFPTAPRLNSELKLSIKNEFDNELKELGNPEENLPTLSNEIYNWVSTELEFAKKL